MSYRFRLSILIALLALAFAACNKKSEPKGEKHYDLEGKVVSVDKSAGEITIQHQEIVGFMKGMTMPFKVGPNDKWALDRAQAGDSVSATLVITDQEGFLSNISLTQAASPNAEPAANASAGPEPGAAVPDFGFINQDGKHLRMSEFRGGPVLLTFIYTRCPLPNYCLRMSSNFERVARQLEQESPDVWKRTHLLSVSFDPEFDKPKILEKYGHSYAGAIDPEFRQWQFVTGTTDEIAKAAKYFGLVYDKQNNQYIHSLRTALIDKHGKVVAVYHGNEWKPEDVAKQIAALK
jgi:protein SCO1/2